MKRIILILFMSFMAIGQAIHAQSTADKLYSQGVTYMKTMTIASQKKAISSFEKAKIAFDSQAKKNLCDEQIIACRNIIQKLTTPKSKLDPKVQTPPMTIDTSKTTPIENIVMPKTEISINPSEITIPAKGGKYIEVSVDCNDGEWKVGACPDWISFTSSSTKLLVKAERNKDKKNERAGIITIVANGTKAELIVKQLKAGILDFIQIKK